MCVECGCQTAEDVAAAAAQDAGVTSGTHRIDGFIVPEAGDLEVVNVGGRAIAVTVVEGQVYAFDDECTHAQCSLSEGDIEGLSVICACHFGQFDLRSGKVLGGPPERPIRTYPARLDGDALELDV